jgi:probable rRNA maturation factor
LKKIIINYENEQNIIEITSKIKNIIKNVIGNVLEIEGFNYDTKVDVSFVNNQTIKNINSEYRNIDKVTDVLSFPILDINHEDGYSKCLSLTDYDYETNTYILGDVIISLERVLAQAIEFGHSFERELGFLIAHSTLHLLGYDHITNKEEDRMNTICEKVMKVMQLER